MKNLIFVLFILGFIINTQAQTFKVIVNSNNAVTTLSKKEASNYFLKKKSKWASGGKVVPVDQKGNSAVRKSFSQDVHGKPSGAIKSYWQQALFSGQGVPPAEKPSDAEVIAFVKANPGAIGYVSSGANTSGVKVVTIQ